MSGMTPIFIAAGIMLAVGLLTVLAWFLYSFYLDRVEHRLAGRKGLYRELVSELATRDRALLEPTINQIRTLYDLDALEAVLEEQARTATGRPGWLLDVYDQLGLVDKYIDKLRNAGKWRDRAFAAELLGRVGGARAVPALLSTIQATQTEDSDVREIALRALARIGDPGAVEPLVAALASADSWLAPRIADILARHGELAVDRLVDLLSSKGRDPARAWAANVLGEVRAGRALPVLVLALDDPSDEVRAKAATALGRLNDRRALASLLEHLLTDPAPFVRARIASSLAQFGGPEVIDRLVRTLGDSAWWVRMRGVEALEHIGPTAEGPLLVALDDPDPEIRQRAAVSLERLGLPTTLIPTIESGDPEGKASRTLSRLVAVGTRELVTELLLHPSASVRGTVIGAIREARRADVPTELIRLASGDTESSLRALALDALRTLRVKEASRTALAALADSDQQVRLAAIRLLGELDGREAADALRSQAADAAPEIRAAAARGLGAIGGRSGQLELLRLMSDPHAAVREAAVAGAADAGLPITDTILTAVLQDSDARVRRAGVRATALSGDVSAVPVLLDAFRTAAPDLRYYIILSVSRLEPDAVSQLVDALVQSQDLDSRLALARILGHLRWTGGIYHLSRLARDAEPAIRTVAIEALGRRAAVEGPVADAVADALSAGLADPITSVRATAADACGRLQLRHYGRTLIQLLEADPAAEVRERAALALGILRVPGGEEALIAACRRREPPAVRAAAALGAGAFTRGSLVTLILEMPDEATVRQLLRERLKHDPWFRLLSRKLPPTSDIELRALAAPTGEDQASLADGMQRLLDAGERVRLISGLRAFQGEHSRVALLQIVRSDPSADVRTAALTSVAELLDPDERLAFGSRALGDPSVMVRRAAVSLFARVPPERSLPRLIQALRVDDDPAVLAAVANLAEQHFEPFRAAVLAVPLQESRAVLVARISRYVHHPDLAGVLAFISRSGSPEVRETVADVWRHRPDASDAVALESLTADPAISVRLTATSAAAAAQRYDLLERLTQDPDPSIRREVAIVLGKLSTLGGGGEVVLQRLEADTEMVVRAAAHVARLLQGIPVPLPPGLDPIVAAEAVRDTSDLESLRAIARSAPSEDRRLAAALALALIQDDVAKDVARSDPAPSIRHRVAGALELSMPAASGDVP
jgi:HEAT repeat protein